MFLLRTGTMRPKPCKREMPSSRHTFRLTLPRKGSILHGRRSHDRSGPVMVRVARRNLHRALGRHPAKLKFNVTRRTRTRAALAGCRLRCLYRLRRGRGGGRLRTSSADFRTQEFRIASMSPISGLQDRVRSRGFYESERLLIRTATGFVDRTVAAGFGFPTGCESGVAGDFDNDTDLDLYLVCRSQVDNPPDLLYENLGNGTFNRGAGRRGRSWRQGRQATPLT